MRQPLQHLKLFGLLLSISSTPLIAVSNPGQSPMAPLSPSQNNYNASQLNTSEQAASLRSQNRRRGELKILEDKLKSLHEQLASERARQAQAGHNPEVAQETRMLERRIHDLGMEIEEKRSHLENNPQFHAARLEHFNGDIHQQRIKDPRHLPEFMPESATEEERDAKWQSLSVNQRSALWQKYCEMIGNARGDNRCKGPEQEPAWMKRLKESNRQRAEQRRSLTPGHHIPTPPPLPPRGEINTTEIQPELQPTSQPSSEGMQPQVGCPACEDRKVIENLARVSQAITDAIKELQGEQVLAQPHQATSPVKEIPTLEELKQRGREKYAHAPWNQKNQPQHAPQSEQGVAELQQPAQLNEELQPSAPEAGAMIEGSAPLFPVEGYRTPSLEDLKQRGREQYAHKPWHNQSQPQHPPQSEQGVAELQQPAQLNEELQPSAPEAGAMTGVPAPLSSVKDYRTPSLEELKQRGREQYAHKPWHNQSQPHHTTQSEQDVAELQQPEQLNAELQPTEPEAAMTGAPAPLPAVKDYRTPSLEDLKQRGRAQYGHKAWNQGGTTPEPLVAYQPAGHQR